MKTPEEIAREVAATATLSDAENPETGAHEPVIEDLAQLASFIEDGIRADRAQRIPATSASDRYEEARAALGRFDQFLHPNTLEGENAAMRVADALRALIEPAPIEGPNGAETERVYREAYEREKRTGAGEMWASAAARRAVYDLGIQHSWEQWEPENAPGHGQRWEYGVAGDDVPETASNRVWTSPDAEGMTYEEAVLHARSTTRKSHPAHVERRLVTDWEVVR